MRGYISLLLPSLVSLSSQRSRALEHRNLLGIQLVNQNDELVLLYEKQEIFKNISTTGQQQFHDLQTRVSQYHISIQDLIRRLEVYRKQIPSLSVYASTTRTLEELKKQLDALRKETDQMCKHLEGKQQTETPQQLDQINDSKSHDADATALVPVDDKENISSSSTSNNKGGTNLSQLSRIRLLKGTDPIFPAIRREDTCIRESFDHQE
jgi:paraquat-inducible protein B